MPTIMADGMKIFNCIDEATQAKMITQSQQNSQCEKPAIVQNGNTYITDLKCKTKGVESIVHAENTFESDTSMRGKVRITTGAVEMSMLTTNVYLGECPAGMKPGEVSMQGANGMVFAPGKMR